MHNQSPPNYICPICTAVAGVEGDATLICQSDIVYKDEHVMAFIASYFIGKNEGHVVVVPNAHYENIYDLPDEVGARVFSVAKKIAKAMPAAYQCSGITTLQNNGIDAGQHAFHYHLHLFPRYPNDELYSHMTNKRSTTQEQRMKYANLLRASL